MRPRGSWWLLCGVSVALATVQPACSFDASGITYISADDSNDVQTDAQIKVDGLTTVDAPLPASDGPSCTSGFVRCGAVCVDLKVNPAHCGKCNAPCTAPRADSCVNGSCRCGSGAPCVAGLDCQSGVCKCVAGGSCAGCCQNGSCALPSNQSALRCGTGGQPCQICPTSTPCSATSCAAGVCTHTAVADGTTCDDGKYCTVGDHCAGGACVGAPMNCAAQMSILTCGIALCIEATDTCSPICQSGKCGSKGTCVKVGFNGCKCVPSKP